MHAQSKFERNDVGGCGRDKQTEEQESSKLQAAVQQVGSCYAACRRTADLTATSLLAVCPQTKVAQGGVARSAGNMYMVNWHSGMAAARKVLLYACQSDHKIM